MSYLTVKNWAEYQHYKDRNPPWIKLYKDQFQDYEFGCLQDASKLLALCIMTLAARDKHGKVPADFAWIKKQGNLSDLIQEEHLLELVNKGFVIDASNVLAMCKQDASMKTETETLKEKYEIDKSISKKKFKKPTIKEIEDYCRERKNSVSPERFFDFYESKGWKVGNNSMKDWQAAVRNWERKEVDDKKPGYADFSQNDYHAGTF